MPRSIGQLGDTNRANAVVHLAGVLMDARDTLESPTPSIQERVNFTERAKLCCPDIDDLVAVIA